MNIVSYLVTWFCQLVLKSVDSKWVMNLNLYRRNLRLDKSIYENSVNSVDRINWTEIIDLFGFGSFFTFKNSGPHFFKIQNLWTPNRPNRIDQMSTPNIHRGKKWYFAVCPTKKPTAKNAWHRPNSWTTPLRLLALVRHQQARQTHRSRLLG
jgi:hypothetical protein